MRKVRGDEVMFKSLLQVWSATDLNKTSKVLGGCLLVSIGILVLNHARLITGGTAGLALSLTYFWGIPFSIMFFFLNIPFYILSIMRMGWSFTFSTFFAVISLSLMTELDRWIPDFVISSFTGAVLSGGLIGLGLAIVCVNGSSLGGVNILTLYLQKRFNWDPGKVTFLIDAAVVVSGIFSVGLLQGLYSILSIAIISGIISYYKGRIASTMPMVRPVVSCYPCK